MERQIVSFRQDDVGDWVAVLDCGHSQHVRHTPPMFDRPWVLEPAGRARFIGHTLNCRICDGDDIHALIPEIQQEAASGLEDGRSWGLVRSL